MLSLNTIPRSDRLLICCNSNGQYRGSLCAFCLSTNKCDCTVARYDKNGDYVIDFACVDCAIGWLEISDRKEKLVV